MLAAVTSSKQLHSINSFFCSQTGLLLIALLNGGCLLQVSLWYPLPAACEAAMQSPGVHVSVCAVQVARGIETTVVKLVKELEAMSVEVTDDELANVATVAAGNNEVVSRAALWQPMQLKAALPRMLGAVL